MSRKRKKIALRCLRAACTAVRSCRRNIQFGYEILAVTPERGIARWWASFVIVPQQLKTKLDGIFVIALDHRGKCLQLREWWHKHQPSN